MQEEKGNYLGRGAERRERWWRGVREGVGSGVQREAVWHTPHIA